MKQLLSIIGFGLSILILIPGSGFASPEGSGASRKQAITFWCLEFPYKVDFTHSQVVAIQTKILPGAQKAFDGINEGYRFGKFGYLDVLDGQKTLFAAKGQYLEALADYHKAVVDVERLTEKPLASANPPLGKPEGEEKP